MIKTSEDFFFLNERARDQVFYRLYDGVQNKSTAVAVK